MRLKYPYFWQSNSIVSLLLIPFSWIFSLLTLLRKFFARTEMIGKYVICVGNITSGGTGKTQIIKWLAEHLNTREISFVIITKGYGGKLKAPTLVSDAHNAILVGDESVELSKYGQVIAAPKILDAKKLLSEINADIILVDDGMQNPWFKKNLTILAIDSDRLTGNGRIIPAGPLRESLDSGLSRADLVIKVGNKKSTDSRFNKVIAKCNTPSFSAKIKAHTETKLNHTAFVAFAGIGNPDRFFTTLTEMKLNIVEQIPFPDHYYYSEKDISTLLGTANQHSAQLITTRKDIVKIPKDMTKQIVVLDVDLDFANDATKMREFLDETLPKKL